MLNCPEIIMYFSKFYLINIRKKKHISVAVANEDNPILFAELPMFMSRYRLEIFCYFILNFRIYWNNKFMIYDIKLHF